MNGSYFSPNGRAKLKNYAQAGGELGPVASLQAFARPAVEPLFHLGCFLFTFWRERSAAARAAGGEFYERQ